ncbi:MAG: hypothetical protein V4612_00700 [Pseudomonadota bacterium]
MDNQTESNSLIRELKAQMRHEKIMGHLKTNQKLIIGFLAAIVAAAIIWTSVSFYNQIQSKKYSAILHQAMIDEQKGELEKSTATLKQIYQSHAPAGVKEIASLKYAAQILKNDQDQAAEIYLAINKNKRFDSYVREYSGLIALKIFVGEDRPENQEKIMALISSLEKNSKILQYHILEQKGINQWNVGNFKEANQVFKSLADNPEVSDMLKKRAAEMVALYVSRFGAEEEKPAEKKVDQKAVEQKVETKK